MNSEADIALSGFKGAVLEMFLKEVSLTFWQFLKTESQILSCSFSIWTGREMHSAYVQIIKSKEYGYSPYFPQAFEYNSYCYKYIYTWPILEIN